MNGALTIVRPPGLAPARALCHGCAMIKPDARAGGCFLSLLIIAGFIAFRFAFDASTMVRYLIMAAGLLAGLGAGKLAASRT